MGLKITRSKDTRIVKAILQKIADIPGGVTVSIATLGGTSLVEGTPIGAPDITTGLCQVAKTATLITNATIAATTYEVAKGHQFKVGDYFTIGANNGQIITAIDKTTNVAKDVITLGATLGAAFTAPLNANQTTAVNQVLAVTPVAITGANYDIVAGENLLVDAWLIAVVRESIAPPVTAAMKTALKGVIYI